MGRVYDDSTLRCSEANLCNALKTAESISPVILFIHKLDKAFVGGTGAADSYGGTSSRIFGSLLDLDARKNITCFCDNNCELSGHLAGEFLRKGGFDEIFFVDRLTSDER